jgi:hypothetical protein
MYYHNIVIDTFEVLSAHFGRNGFIKLTPAHFGDRTVDIACAAGDESVGDHLCPNR